MVYAPDPALAALLERTAWRHLPGQHDQMTHGGKGSFELQAAEASSGDDARRLADPRFALDGRQRAAVERYGGNDSFAVNAALRQHSGNVENLDPDDRETTEALDSIMGSARLRGDILVHRHIGRAEDVFPDVDIEIDLSGLSWRDHGFVSTSKEDRGVSNGLQLKMRILVRSGTPGFSHAFLDSDEILLGRGLKFSVVNDHGLDDWGVRRLDVLVEAPE